MAGTAKRAIIEENGIKLTLRDFKKQSDKLQFYNPKLSSIRNVILATLAIESSENSKLLCLDGISRSGIAGTQWKIHLGDAVNVIMADKDVDPVKQCSDMNQVKYTDWRLDPGRVVGELPVESQGKNEVYVCPFPAQTVLHQEAFNFVYLHTKQSTTMFTHSVFANIRNNGVACFLCSNITSQCFRSPSLIQRQYQAHVQKTEYVKEMAMRVLISDIARAAACYQRGIQVLYCLSAEEQFLVVVRVTKNNQSAVDSVEQCGRVLHCLMCEARSPLPNINTPIENPYSLLPCDCKSTNPGKTATTLGPMWLGEIFSVDYLQTLIGECTKMNVDKKMLSLLSVVLAEAVCDDKDDIIVESSKDVGKIASKKVKANTKGSGVIETENGPSENQAKSKAAEAVETNSEVKSFMKSEVETADVKVSATEEATESAGGKGAIKDEVLKSKADPQPGSSKRKHGGKKGDDEPGSSKNDRKRVKKADDQSGSSKSDVKKDRVVEQAGVRDEVEEGRQDVHDEEEMEAELSDSGPDDNDGESGEPPAKRSRLENTFKYMREACNAVADAYKRRSVERIAAAAVAGDIDPEAVGVEVQNFEMIDEEFKYINETWDNLEETSKILDQSCRTLERSCIRLAQTCRNMVGRIVNNHPAGEGEQVNNDQDELWNNEDVNNDEDANDGEVANNGEVVNNEGVNNGEIANDNAEPYNANSDNKEHEEEDGNVAPKAVAKLEGESITVKQDNEGVSANVPVADGGVPDEQGDRKKKRAHSAGKSCVGPCKEQTTKHSPTPIFYHDTQKKKCSGYPKLTKLVSVMHQHGYRAARTHFESYGIRTNATLTQMDAVVKKYLQSQKS